MELQEQWSPGLSDEQVCGELAEVTDSDQKEEAEEDSDEAEFVEYAGQGVGTISAEEATVLDGRAWWRPKPHFVADARGES